MCKKVLKYVAFLMGLLFAAGVWAADFPSYERLGGMGSLDMPTVVATDAAGNVYVGDRVAEAVVIFSSDGERIGRISLQSAPTALEIADNGFLYVGMENGINIYNGEDLVDTISGVSLPAAIEVSSGGVVYVLDAGEYNLKIIDGSGNIAVVGDYQMFGGDLRDLALDEANGELYELDRGHLLDDGSGVWRVQVFDLQGNLLRSFSHWGYATDGKLLSASSIEVDEQRRIYIADNSQNIIGVYDHTGAYIGTMYDNQDVYRNPVGMAYRNNRLYFVSSLGRSATVLGVGAYATLDVSPLQLSLTVQGGYVDGGNTITIANTGVGDLNWQASVTAGAGWLSVSSQSGTVAPSGQTAVDVAVDASSLSAGQHSGTITITSNGGSAEINVVVNVVAAPVLEVSPSVVNLQAVAGEPVSVPGINITLSNDISNSLTWQAVADAGIDISPSSGPSNTTTSPSVTVAAQGAGTYTGRITVTADGAVGSPAEITLNIEFVAVNRIHVTTNHPDAAFSITGPQNYQGSGTDWSVSGVPDGEYTIVFHDINGYVTPPSVTKSLSGGGTIEFSGDYSRMITERIVVVPDSTKKAAAVVRIMDADGTVLKEIDVPAPGRGGLDVAVADVDGDGLEDIVVSTLKKSSMIWVFSAAGAEMTSADVFSSSAGVMLAAADTDGDGDAEIVAASGTDVRVLDFQSGSIVDTGAGFSAAAAVDAVGAGDVDGDGAAEVVTASRSADGMVAFDIWRIDTVNGAVLDSEMIMADEKIKDIEIRDMDGDGIGDVLVASRGSIIMLDIGGNAASEMVKVKGLKSLAAGDVDGDGSVEMTAGLKRGKLRTYTADGSETGTIKAFKTKSGVRVSTGVVGY